MAKRGLLRNQDQQAQAADAIDVKEQQEQQALAQQEQQTPEQQEQQAKLLAAYALNMCTVSVSQIVEYQDLYIMEQEYDAILNNLNLENMPKDEALLNILKQILDVITFFRIQDGDRKMIEKEYQHKMKNAIWSATPNISGLVGSTPISIVASLATQVGVGYMNYRRQKAENQLEKGKEEWRLQRSAIEQLNALRRELFDTAWRLADNYHFPDNYRLTEHQIKRYNEVLMDVDPLRRYERLKYMEEFFEAYPPFWYQLGHAANEVYLNNKQMDDYYDYALECYDAFLSKTDHNLLREDQLKSSCALEKFGLVKMNGNSDSSQLTDLIQTAIRSAGNAYDVIQICVISYLSINEKTNAKKELRMLVNEGYNPVMNAQLLSKIYIEEGLNQTAEKPSTDYQTLAQRVNCRYLYPWENDESKFLDSQKRALLDKFSLVTDQLIEKYMIEYNRVMPYSLEQSNLIIGDDYSDDPELLMQRKSRVKEIFDQKRETEYVLQVSDAVVRRLEILNDLCEQIGHFSIGEGYGAAFYKKIEEYLCAENRRDYLKKPTTAANICKIIDDFSFTKVTYDAFMFVASTIFQAVQNCKSMKELSSIEMNLHQYCDSQRFTLPELPYSDDAVFEIAKPDQQDLRNLMGASIDEIKLKHEQRQQMLEIIKKYKEELLGPTAKTVFSVYPEPQFLDYFKNKHNSVFFKVRGDALAVLDDQSKSDNDIVLLLNRLWDGSKKSLFNRTAIMSQYSQVTQEGKGLKIGTSKYEYNGLKCEQFYKMCKELSDVVTTFHPQPNWESTVSEAIGDLRSDVRDEFSGSSFAAEEEKTDAAEEEKTKFDVVLKSAGANKIAVIKIVRSLTGLSLKEANELVDGAPKTLKKAVSKDMAEKIAACLKKDGAEADIICCTPDGQEQTLDLS